MLYRAALHKKIRRVKCLQDGRKLPRAAAKAAATFQIGCRHHREKRCRRTILFDSARRFCDYVVNNVEFGRMRAARGRPVGFDVHIWTHVTDAGVPDVCGWVGCPWVMR
jgi:hypothetical protein